MIVISGQESLLAIFANDEIGVTVMTHLVKKFTIFGFSLFDIYSLSDNHAEHT